MVYADVEVGVQRYSYYGELPNVENFWSMSEEMLEPWWGPYAFHFDAICLIRAILLTRFRYMNGSPFLDEAGQMGGSCPVDN